MTDATPALSASPESTASAEPPPAPRLPTWKKALFALVTVVGFFALLEGALALVGVRPILFADDPYVGFASNIPLFVEHRDDDGRLWMETAPNKLRWFNQQRFAARKDRGVYRIFSLGGSTTYGRPYDDKGSFSAWLREFLPAADPSRRWEVINAGGISYASYRVAVVMEELAEYDPDLFIVYAGHNEFLEKRTYPEISAAPQLLSEAGGLLSRTRIFAAAQTALDAARKPSEQEAPVLKAEVDTMLEHSVGPSQYTRDEDWRADVIEHYDFNLRRMVDIARAAGAEIVFVEPAADLRGSSPFKSEHRDGLSRQDREEFSTLLEQGTALRESGNAAESLRLLDQAIAMDDRFAHAHFERGRALYDLERGEEAQAAFQRAIDEDICPLRILTPMRRILREVAAETGTPLVDFAALIEGRSPRGVSGPEYFLDHVHLNLEGYRLLALQLLEDLADRNVATISPNWGDASLAEVEATVESRIDARAQAVALRNLAKVLDWAGKQEEAARMAAQASEQLGPDAESLNVLGRAALSQGRRREAIEYFEKALEARPGYLEPLTSLGIALQETGRIEEAIAALQAAVDSKPDFAEAHYNLGSALMAAGRTDEAIASYRAALRNDSDHAPAHNNLGVALASLGRVDEAIPSYGAALSIRPDYVEARLNLGLALQAKGEREAGAAMLEQALAEQPDSPEALVNVGNAMLASNRVDRAITLYGRALELDPSSSVARFNMANALLGSGRPAEAVSSYRQAAGLDPESVEIQTNLGRALLASGRKNEAVDAYRKALKLEPDSAEARFNAAVALGEAGRTREAMALYQEAVKIRPDYADAYSNWGNLLLAGNRLSDAIAKYERALALQPDFVDAHYNLGMALGLSRDVDGAIQHFSRTVELQPEHFQGHHFLATSLDLAGKSNEALEHARIAARLNPQWAAPLNLSAEILIRSSAEQPGAANEALKLALKAREITDGRDPPTLQTLAAAYAARADYGRAADALAKALEQYRAAGALPEASAAEELLAEYRSRARGRQTR